MTDTVRIAAHAKVNTLLRVLARETTGYHGLETVFSLLDLADEITVHRSDEGIALTVTGADTGPDEENLAYRAAALVLEATGRKFGVRLTLDKHVPVQAGLGGGSSDAAATLHAVNLLAGNAVPRHELLQFAARLGADVPFFASGAPMALAWNRGERLFRLPPPPSAPVLLAIPPFGVSTAAAYKSLDESEGEPSRRGCVVLDADAFRTWGGIGRLGGNDFESVLFGREPRLRTLFERMAETRPLITRVSGSGSAVFAVYKSTRDLEDAVVMIGTRDQKLVTTATRATAAPGPAPIGTHGASRS